MSNILKKCSLLLTACCTLTLYTASFSSMIAICEKGPYPVSPDRPYICCPAKGGWIVSDNCDSGASQACINDNGKIAGTQTSILQDCKKHAGDHVAYLY